MRDADSDLEPLPFYRDRVHGLTLSENVIT